MKIETSVFRGAIRAIEASRLGDEYAAEAVNCDLRTGAIIPLSLGSVRDKPLRIRPLVWRG